MKNVSDLGDKLINMTEKGKTDVIIFLMFVCLLLLFLSMLQFSKENLCIRSRILMSVWCNTLCHCTTAHSGVTLNGFFLFCAKI